MLRARMETDVLVVGGGLAGVAAAVGAARAGAKTLLVEASGTVGGTATAGLNASFMGVDTGLMGGLVREIIQELRRREGAIHGVYTPFSVEALKDICFELLGGAGVGLLFHTAAEEVVMNGPKVEGVVFRHKSGRDMIRSWVTVDASGDADVAAAAGAEHELGDPKTGELQPVSLLFRMGNVDVPELIAYVQATPNQFYKEHLLFVCDTSVDPPLLVANGFFDWVREQKANGLYLGREALAIIGSPNPREVLINATRTTGVNALDPFQLSHGILDARRQMQSLVGRLRAAMPGFAHAYVVETASQIGVRETRRVVGEYQLTEEDVIEARDFEDRIARNFFPIDIHGPQSNPMGYLWLVPKEGRAYSIPYRCLVPRRIDGLLVGGRCISATHVAFGSTRTMPCCIATGQAAGVAATVSLSERVQPRAVTVQRVQELLRRQGVPI